MESNTTKSDTIIPETVDKPDPCALNDLDHVESGHDESPVHGTLGLAFEIR